MIGNLSPVNFIVEKTSRIDAHAVALLVFLAPLSLLGLPLKMAVLLIFTVPQIRILTHAFVHYPVFQRNPTSYLLVNEIALALLAALCWGVGRLF